MATEKMKTSFYDVVYLSGCAVNVNCPDPERVRKMDFDSTYEAACSLSLAALTYLALESACDGNLPEDPALKKWKEKSNLALYNAKIMDKESAGCILVSFCYKKEKICVNHEKNIPYLVQTVMKGYKI